MKEKELQIFISTLDPYRTNLVSVMLLSSLLHCIIWIDRSVRRYELNQLHNLYAQQEERKKTVELIKQQTMNNKVNEMSSPFKFNNSPSKHVNKYNSFHDLYQSKTDFNSNSNDHNSDENENNNNSNYYNNNENKNTKEKDEILVEAVELSLLNENDSKLFEKWFNAKSQQVGVKTVSRLLFGAIFEYLRSVKTTFLTIDAIQLIFCSLCINQTIEIQLQKILNAALNYILKCRQLKIENYSGEFNEWFYLEQRLIFKSLFTCEQVMDIIYQNIHDIGTIMQEQFNTVWNLCGNAEIL